MPPARRSRMMTNLAEGFVLGALTAVLLVALMWAVRFQVPVYVPESGDNTQAIGLAGQVVPATVVAVFVFAIGAVLVIAR